MSVKIALLGEVTAQVGQRSVDLGTPRQRCVLAALAVDAGRLVPVDRLVGRVWGTDTPRRGRATLHTHISRLRGAFAGAVALVHRSGGYTLEVNQPQQAVDLLQFRALLDQADSAGDDTHRAALLTEALSLWRGEPLSGLSGEWVEGERDRWQQERRTAEHDLVDAQLRIGHGDELVAPLSARATQHPLDERVAGQYMLALHRAGRPADALAHYWQLRELLVEELGTDPGHALQNLYQQILAADPSLRSAAAGPAVEPMAIPRQLPAAPATFVGRSAELDRLDVTLPASSPAAMSAEGFPVASISEQALSGRMMLISAIGGAGGVGKTWLALHWAHHHLDRFPDGQLFADLRGFSPTRHPARPIDVLGGFLDALGVERDRQPTELDRRAELYRSLVADKRLLIVLDNAATIEQVTPLLPGGHHCTVVITSRNQLRGLIARHGVRPINLNVLTDTEAHTLLAAALDADRTTADARAIRELIELCGGFPLALGLIAARMAVDPHLPLADTVAELRAVGLDALDSEDPTASLPTVLSWSLHHLNHRQRQMFALLGIAPGPDIGLPAAAALAGLPEREAHAVLRALVDASLIYRVPGGRYAMHDLVRAYAVSVAENSPDDVSAEVRETALRRVLDCYMHTAHTAERLLAPHGDPAPFDPPTHKTVHLQTLGDAAAALAWFDTEHACLLAAQRTAITYDWHATVWHLAWSLHTFHYWRGHLHDRLTVWQAAAEAATHLPDPTAHSLAHRFLGRAHADLGQHEHVLDQLHKALTLAEHQRNPAEQAHTHDALATAWVRRGDDRKGLYHARLALNLFRSHGQPVQEAIALNAVGWCAARLGDYDTARDHCHAALTLARRHRDLTGQAAILDSLGYIEHHTGHHVRAIDHYHQALTLLRELGNIYQTANTVDSLGHPHAALGQYEQARTAWQEARQLYRRQGRHDDAARVQRQLDDLDARDQPAQNNETMT